MPQIGIIVGSDSDLPKIADCFNLLDEFGVSFEIIISSAHRTPEKTKEWAASAKERGINVVIAAAGGAAHLPGVVASHTILPVIGVPIETNIAGGLDSILSIVQMPSGIPVAAMSSGKAGGANSALFAISILSINNNELSAKLANYRKNMSDKITAKNKELNAKGYVKYINDLKGKE
jgi:5-(carboxyamino)imidazole ribonucleotide mutase